MKIIYHIFTDNRDVWREDYSQARTWFKHFKRAYGTARLYEEVLDDEGETVEENYLRSFGPFPA